jgi:hypothetical protein
VNFPHRVRLVLEVELVQRIHDKIGDNRPLKAILSPDGELSNRLLKYQVPLESLERLLLPLIFPAFLKRLNKRNLAPPS